MAARTASRKASPLPRRATDAERSDVDTRLVLQLGMVLALLYVAFVCVWLSRTRGARSVERALRRVGMPWSALLARAGFVSAPPAGARDSASTCAIAWKRGHLRSRFQAVIFTPGDRKRRVVAESDGLRWPPKDTRNPPTRELEAALAALVAKIVAAGWEPVPSEGSWTERRFVWRATNLVALDVGDTLSVPGERSVVPARRLSALTVAVVLAAATTLGLLLARAIVGGGERTTPVRPATEAKPIAHGGLRVQLASGWTAAEAVTLPGFSRPLGLANEGERLRAVVERLPATSPTLLPAAFERTVPAPGARPDAVRLASGQPAWRYRFAKADGSVTVLYAAPTTAGVATVACMSPAGAGVPRGCATLASGLAVPGARPLEPGISSAFFSRLPAAVSDLDRARREGMRDLATATDPAGQAKAAAGLVGAHQAATAALAPLAVKGAALPARTVGALSAAATSYATLAGAARAHSPLGYAAAGRGVSEADADLRRTLTRASAAMSAASAGGHVARTPAARKSAGAGTAGSELTLPLLALAGMAALTLVVWTVRRDS